MVQEDLTKRHKFKGKVIDFQVENKEPTRVIRKAVENAASEYKNTTTEYKQKDAPNKTVTFGSRNL